MNDILLQAAKNNGKGTDVWSTPPKFFRWLERELEVEFDLDPCANPENRKCERFFTEKDNGLIQPWHANAVFVNPPYSDVRKWIEKSIQEIERGNANTIAMLIPARTDTTYWHDLIGVHASEVWLLRGRIQFLAPGAVVKSCATFPSAAVVFKTRRGNELVYKHKDWK